MRRADPDAAHTHCPAPSFTTAAYIVGSGLILILRVAIGARSPMRSELCRGVIADSAVRSVLVVVPSPGRVADSGLCQ